MTNPGHDPGHPHAAHIEADAVCELCNTVNPPDTLLCKKCGNNLRDQRMRRMHLDIMEDDRKIPPSKWLTGLLTVFGLLLILWVALNVTNFERIVAPTMAKTQGEDAGVDPRDFWEGDSAGDFDALVQELRSVELTAADLSSASTLPLTIETLPGLYILKSNSSAHAPVIGQAIVEASGESFLFAGILADQAEVRGYADVLGAGSLKASFIGVRTADGYIDAYGAASISATGGLECEGLPSSVDPNATLDRPYAIYAIKLSR